MNGQYGSIRDFNNLRVWALALRFWEQCDSDRRISGRRDCAADSDMTFKETLKQAAAEVDTWPRWKREALGVVHVLRIKPGDEGRYDNRRNRRRHHCDSDAACVEV